jgi:hypothetical protein
LQKELEQERVAARVAARVAEESIAELRRELQKTRGFLERADLEAAGNTNRAIAAEAELAEISKRRRR